MTVDSSAGSTQWGLIKLLQASVLVKQLEERRGALVCFW